VYTTYNNTFAIQVEKVSIIFSDFVNFSDKTKGLEPNTLVYFLNLMFSKFDSLLKFYEIEKVKTMGDGYMAVCGITSDDTDSGNHAEKCSLWALAVREYIDHINENPKLYPLLPKNVFPIELRIGIATGGPIIAGIIGNQRLQFDIWGNTVNLASRMESNAKPGTIQVNDECYEKVKYLFNFEEKREIEVKGIGLVDSYFLNSSKNEKERHLILGDVLLSNETETDEVIKKKNIKKEEEIDLDLN